MSKTSLRWSQYFDTNCATELLTTDGFVARMDRLPYPFQHFVVEPEQAEQFGEPLLQHFLARVLTPAIRRIALTFIGVSSAVVIDVALLFDFTDHRAAALGAGN